MQFLRFFRELSSHLCLPEESIEPVVDTTVHPMPSRGSSERRRAPSNLRAIPPFVELVDPLVTRLERGEVSGEQLGEVVQAIISAFEEDAVRVKLTSVVGSHLRKASSSEDSFLRELIRQALSEAEASSLHQTLKDLPSGVLGDEAQQEESRVFVNALQDTRASIQHHQRAFNRLKKYKDNSDFVERTIGAIVRALSNEGVDPSIRISAYTCMMTTLASPLAKASIGKLPPPLFHSTDPDSAPVFQQIILSGRLSSSSQQRSAELAILFD